jgi:hypothetical protein
VARGALPILRAIKSQPIAAQDSGWQFLCDSGVEEDMADAQIWTVAEVLALEPTLTDHVDAPGGTQLERREPQSNWQVFFVH